MQMDAFRWLVLRRLLILALVLLAGCASQNERVVLATTTSTYDSGLLGFILPEFERESGIRVDVLSLGTGEAIAAAGRGDVDLVLVHSKSAEEKFLQDGGGIHRVGVMYNDFVVVGPNEDPAGIKGEKNVTLAFRKIADANSLFISRGDNSGTHVKEKQIWEKTGIATKNYLEVGSGMGDTLRIAGEKKAYALSDRATWISMREKLPLELLVEGDRSLLNPYGLLLTDPEKRPNVNYKGALELAKFLLSERGQEMIGGFKKNNETLFVPIAHDIGRAKNLGFPLQEKEMEWYGRTG